MVDLVKIRKKKQRNAAVAAAGEAASPPPETAPAEPPAPAGEDAGAPAGGDASVPQATSKLEKFKQQAGKRREIATASVDETSTEQQLELLTFVIAGEQYAVDIERIVEIVTPRPVTRIPNADASVVGIISLRGTIVTLVDVRRKLRHAASQQENADTRIVVIDYHNEMVGFVVDRVLRVVKAATADINPHPVVHATELDDSVRGVFRVGGALTILLDLDKLLDHRALAATS
jgi:purine-binding chemotaxis protein CheW